MKQIFYIALLAAGCCMPGANAQTEKNAKPQLTTEEQRIQESREGRFRMYAEKLEEEKQEVIATEKYRLKVAVEKITAQLAAGEITAEEAQAQKEAAAKNTALNIDNKTAILENQIALAKRQEGYDTPEVKGTYLALGFGNAYDDKGSFLLGMHLEVGDIKKKFDKRTYSDVVFATGFNNTVGDGRTIGDSYKFGKSTFAELGIALRTRMLKNSNFIRLVYGVSFNLNMLSPKDNQVFVNNNGVTSLEDFPYHLKRRELRISSLVVPFHFEFGSSEKKEYKDYFRYSTLNRFRVGVGGYAGANIGTRQTLKYNNADGKKIISRTSTDYNASKFVYGLSAYAGIESFSLYVKYDLSPVFEHSTYKDHNLSLGLRLDL